MKKRLLTCGALLLAAMSQNANAQLALENFNSLTTTPYAGALPTGWLMINDGHTVSTSFTTVAAIPPALTAYAWMPYQVIATGNYSMITTSKFNPTATADRWLITPAFNVTSDKTIFKWQDYNLSSTDKLQLWISPTGGSTAASFTTKVWDAVPGSGGLTSHAISLSAYNGMNIRVAFRNNMPPQTAPATNWGFIIDNVESVILPNKIDGTMTSVSPQNDHPTAYGLAASNVTLKGVVTNNGANVINNFTINYQQGTGAIKSYTVSSANIAPLGTFAFTHSVPFTIPAVGSYPIKAWIDIASDEVRSNDSGSTTITGVTKMPVKKLVIEEATGTWCGWCVRGIVYMDSLQKLHPNNVSLIAVHNADPMVVSAYDTWMGTKISGYPSVVVDRRAVADPSDIITTYNNEGNYFGFADITLGTPTRTATTYTQPVTVVPATPLNGDYRLAIVMTEDNVTGSGSTWDQHNYYSSGSQGIHLNGAGIDYYNLPATIPASQMHYNFVARAITPSVNGAASGLPAAMAAGTTYTASVTGTLNSTWNNPNMRAVVLLLNNANGYILNSANRAVALGVTNVQAGLEGLTVFPNPAQDAANVSFTLAKASSVQVQVVDALGRTVSTQSEQMTAGAQKVRIELATLAAGVYSVMVRTEGGNVSQTLSVVK